MIELFLCCPISSSRARRVCGRDDYISIPHFCCPPLIGFLVFECIHWLGRLELTLDLANKGHARRTHMSGVLECTRRTFSVHAHCNGGILYSLCKHTYAYHVFISDF